MIKNQEDLMKVLPLKESELRLRAVMEARELLMHDRYKNYDNDFKKNFATGFVETYLTEIRTLRNNVAIKMLNEAQNKGYIMKVTGLTFEELENIKITSNNKEILKIYKEILEKR